MRLLLGLLLVAMIAGPSFAGTADTVVLVVTPAFNLSVNISSTTHEFGDADITLGESRTLCVGNICNDGNVTSYWQKQSADATGETALDWTLQTTGLCDKNEFRLLAVTTGTGVRPGFTGTYDSVDANVLLAGDHELTDYAVTKTWTDLTEGNGNMDHEALTDELSTRSLWVSIMLPRTVTAGDVQSITLSVQALTQ